MSGYAMMEQHVHYAGMQGINQDGAHVIPRCDSGSNGPMGCCCASNHASGSMLWCAHDVLPTLWPLRPFHMGKDYGHVGDVMCAFIGVMGLCYIVAMFDQVCAVHMC
jgi:hypothetical protein